MHIWAKSASRSWDSPRLIARCRAAGLSGGGGGTSQTKALRLQRRHPALTPGLSPCCDGGRERREDTQDSLQKGAGRRLGTALTRPTGQAADRQPGPPGTAPSSSSSNGGNDTLRGLPSKEEGEEARRSISMPGFGGT